MQVTVSKHAEGSKEQHLLGQDKTNKFLGMLAVIFVSDFFDFFFNIQIAWLVKIQSRSCREWLQIVKVAAELVWEAWTVWVILSQYI